MTQQRIDEDTSVDDTLVTCAEYQLFIDEMREQGKYYQPDHWLSFQFPKGKAHEPILGIRHSDANYFCEWLSQREAIEWSYRLPVRDEMKKHPLQSNLRVPSGCWINSARSQKDFYWLKSANDNSRRIEIEDVKDFILKHILKRSDEFDPTQKRSHILDELKIRDFDLSTIVKRNNNMSLDFDDTYRRAIIIENSFPHSNGLAASVYSLYTRNLLGIHKNAIDKPLYSTISIALDLAYYERDRNLALNLFFDLFTLQERIAGRSPAFEGIRLVKERIR